MQHFGTILARNIMNLNVMLTLVKSLNKVLGLALLVIACYATDIQAQTTPESILNNAKTTIKAANSKDLVQYFNDVVEIGFNGEKASYSKTQAEFVMRDFFKKYPPTEFVYEHQGSSKEDVKYAIGNYTYNGGKYRVYILIKQFKGVYLIDTIDFSEE